MTIMCAWGCLSRMRWTTAMIPSAIMSGVCPWLFVPTRRTTTFKKINKKMNRAVCRCFPSVIGVAKLFKSNNTLPYLINKINLPTNPIHKRAASVSPPLYYRFIPGCISRQIHTPAFVWPLTVPTQERLSNRNKQKNPFANTPNRYFIQKKTKNNK